MTPLDQIFLAWTAVLNPSVILIFLALTGVDAIVFTIIDRFI